MLFVGIKHNALIGLRIDSTSRSLSEERSEIISVSSAQLSVIRMEEIPICMVMAKRTRIYSGFQIRCKTIRCVPHISDSLHRFVLRTILFLKLFWAENCVCHDYVKLTRLLLLLRYLLVHYLQVYQL